MEKLAISRLGQVKNISGSKNGKSYSFNKIGFQSNEHGEQWYDFTFNGDSHGLEVGKQYDFEIEERHYTTKEGEERTAFNARFPKKNGGGGISDTDRADIKQSKDNSYAANWNILQLTQRLEAAGLIPPIVKTVPGTNVAYPESNGPTAFDEDVPPLEAYEQDAH